jgi:hypothetical protein
LPSLSLNQRLDASSLGLEAGSGDQSGSEQMVGNSRLARRC